MVLQSIEPLNISNTFDYYVEIVKKKQGDRKKILYGVEDSNTVTFSDLYDRIKFKYSYYDNNTNTLENIEQSAYEADEKEALLHCYNVETIKLFDLKNKIIKNQSGYYQTHCAYCDIGTISTMDHFIPKDDFPEYAIHPYNLIPACSICNGKKLDAFLKNDGSLLVFNPYFEVEGNPILGLNIEFLRSNKSFSFNIEILNEAYSAYFNRLDIVSRYKKMMIGIFDDIRNSLMESFYGHCNNYSSIEQYNVNQIKQLNKTKERWLKDCGINSIHYLLYDAFLKSNYCDIQFLISNFGNEEYREELQTFLGYAE